MSSMPTSAAREGVPLLDLAAQYEVVGDEVRTAIDRVLASQRFILGEEVKALEEEIASYSECRYAVGVSSGTDAILVALMAINVGPGDEVITTPYTFFSTAGCVARLQARPVFVDIDPLTYNIDPGQIEAAVTDRTKAIMPVHLFGQAADMAPIMEVADRHDLHVIEDAAQAIGTEYDGHRIGSIGHLGCFSFYPTKNLGCCGDGGMVVTNDVELAQRVELLRKHGAQPKYHHRVVGGNFRLDALQAAVLRVKLPYLDDWSTARAQNAAAYRALFSEAGLSTEDGSDNATDRAPIGLPSDAGHGRHIYNQFVIRAERRDELLEHLKAAAIGHEIYYPVPLHLQQCFAHLGYRAGDLPESERAAAETVALPVYPELTREQQRTVVDDIRRFYDADG